MEQRFEGLKVKNRQSNIKKPMRLTVLSAATDVDHERDRLLVEFGIRVWKSEGLDRPHQQIVARGAHCGAAGRPNAGRLLAGGSQ